MSDEKRLERKRLRLVQIKREYDAQYHRVTARNATLPKLTSFDAAEKLTPCVLGLNTNIAESLAGSLQLIRELESVCLAAFLYRGESLSA
jgi:hypothetical protein